MVVTPHHGKPRAPTRPMTNAAWSHRVVGVSTTGHSRLQDGTSEIGRHAVTQSRSPARRARKMSDRTSDQINTTPILLLRTRTLPIPTYYSMRSLHHAYEPLIWDPSIHSHTCNACMHTCAYGLARFETALFLRLPDRTRTRTQTRTQTQTLTQTQTQTLTRALHLTSP